MRPLLTLIRLQARAFRRRSLRGVKTWRGAMFLALGMVGFLLWLSTSLINAFIARRPDSEKVQLFFPLAMLGICVSNLASSAGDRAIAFSPPEVDFLFPGPFSRRQLLGYKLTRSALHSLLTTTIFSLIFLRYTQSWLAGWLGFFLALQFLQLFSMAIVLVGQTIGEAAYTRARKLILLAIALAAIVAILPVVHEAREGGYLALAPKFRESQVGKVMLAPFDIYGHVVTAPSIFSRHALWALAAVCVNGALFLLVMRLDAQYMDAAATAGRLHYERIQRFRRGGSMSLRGTPSSRLRIPALPRFAGAGPIAWRQLTTAIRQSRAVISLLLILCVAIGPAIYLGGGAGHSALAAIGGMIFWITMMFANLLRFDFRGDVDHIDTLKAMPVPSFAIAAAQLVAPVIVLTACEMIFLLGLRFGLGVETEILLVGAAFALPFNCLLFAIENLIFLLFPQRIVAVSPGDLQGFGRQSLVFLLKMLALMIGGGIAAGAGGMAYFFSHDSTPVFLLITWVMLAIEAVAMIPALVIAFHRYDPSVDTPA
jgi:hypothetical protein